MLCTQPCLTPAESTLAQRFCLACFAHRQQAKSEVVNGCDRVMVLRTNSCLASSEDAAKERLGLLLPVGGLVQDSKVLCARKRVRVLWRKLRLSALQSPSVQSLGLLELPAHLE